MVKVLYTTGQRLMASALSLACASMILFACGCGNGGGPDQETADPAASHTTKTGSASFSIQWHLDAEAFDSGSEIVRQAIDDCTAAAVAAITCEIYDESGNPVASGGPWTCDSRKGRIEGIPAGKNRTFVVLGWNAGGEEILYHGQTAYGVTIAPGQITNAGTIDANAFVPAGLSIGAVSGSRIDIAWDDLSVAGYRIYRGGVAIDVSGTPVYRDTDVSPGAEYCYTVSAYDAYGNESGQSEQICAATMECGYTVSPQSESFDAGGGAGVIDISTISDCAWSATESSGWIQITSAASGSGSGTVSYTVLPNPGGGERSAVITVAGQAHTVTQAGAACTYAISPQSESFDAGGGAGVIDISTISDCAWSATESSGWIQITSAASGSGSGTVSYTVLPNPGDGERSAVITVAGRSHTVSQAAMPCSYILDPASAAYGPAAGSGGFLVTAPDGCAWTAATESDWIDIVSGGGSGSGTVSYTVAANSSDQGRDGTISVQGQIYSIHQDGTTCTYAISPLTSEFTACGGTGSFNVTAPAGCEWTADAGDGLMIDVTAGKGSGPGIVSFTVSPYFVSGAIRKGRIDVEDAEHQVTQTGGCIFDVSASTLFFNSDGGSELIAVTTETCCEWSAAADYSWISLKPSESIGSGTVSCTVDPNTDDMPRSGTITVAGKSITVYQSVSGVTYVMIGDNDGYGFKEPVGDGKDLPYMHFDNREYPEETDATDGSQYTDYATDERKSFEVEIDFEPVDPLYFDFATFSLDVAGIEQDEYGASILLIGGVDYSRVLPTDQTAVGSDIIEIKIEDAALFKNGYLEVYFMGGEKDYGIAVDYLELRIVTK